MAGKRDQGVCAECGGIAHEEPRTSQVFAHSVGGSHSDNRPRLGGTLDWGRGCGIRARPALVAKRESMAGAPASRCVSRRFPWTVVVGRGRKDRDVLRGEGASQRVQKRGPPSACGNSGIRWVLLREGATCAR